jgi:hypothetical protein
MVEDLNIPQPESRRVSSCSRPLSVTLVASYQFVKGAGALLIFLKIWLDHRAALASSEMAPDALSKDPSLILLPLTALYLGVLGLGVWNLERWARWLILPAFALTVPWAMHLLPSQSSLALLRYILPRPVALLVAALDMLVILVLLLPDERKAFGDGDSDMPWTI